MFIKLLASLLETLLKGASTVPPQKKSFILYMLECYLNDTVHLYFFTSVEIKFTSSIPLSLKTNASISKVTLSIFQCFEINPSI